MPKCRRAASCCRLCCLSFRGQQSCCVALFVCLLVTSLLMTLASDDYATCLATLVTQVVTRCQSGLSSEVATARQFREHVRPNTDWLVQYNVSQYSTVVVLNEPQERSLTIESLFFVDSMLTQDYLLDSIRCVVRLNDNNNNSNNSSSGFTRLVLRSSDLLRIPLMTMVSIWRVRCTMPMFDGTSSNSKHRKQMAVAIVDINEMKRRTVRVGRQEWTLIAYHEPLVFNRSIAKRQAVVNCVHMLRGLDSANHFAELLRWVELQRRIGYARLNIYAYAVNPHAYTVLRERYAGDAFVHIVDYPTSIEHICGWLNDEINSNTSTTTTTKKVYEAAYAACAYSHSIHFAMERDLISNAHERMCTNDCYLKHRHLYQFVTNHDMDELILPRPSVSVANRHRRLVDSCSSSSSSNDTMSTRVGVDIYTFARRLSTKYERMLATPVAFLLFDNFVLFRRALQLLERLGEFAASRSFDPARLQSVFHYEEDGRSVEFQVETSADRRHLAMLDELRARLMSRRLYLTSNSSSNSSKWLRIVGAKMDMRDGKSIFNTDYTESCTQHLSHTVAERSTGMRVPLRHGYVTHARNTIDNFLHGQRYPLAYLRIDIDYLAFVCHLPIFDIHSIAFNMNT